MADTKTEPTAEGEALDAETWAQLQRWALAVVTTPQGQEWDVPPAVRAASEREHQLSCVAIRRIKVHLERVARDPAVLLSLLQALDRAQHALFTEARDGQCALTGTEGPRLLLTLVPSSPSRWFVSRDLHRWLEALYTMGHLPQFLSRYWDARVEQQTELQPLDFNKELEALEASRHTYNAAHAFLARQPTP